MLPSLLVTYANTGVIYAVSAGNEVISTEGLSADTLIYWIRRFVSTLIIASSALHLTCFNKLTCDC